MSNELPMAITSRGARSLGRHLFMCFLHVTAMVGIHNAAITEDSLLINVVSSPLCPANIVFRGPGGLPALRTRNDLGSLMEARGFTDGAEVGVQRGASAAAILSRWPSCESFKLIDLWGQQENYKDLANVNNAMQQTNYEQTISNLKPWESKTEYFRMLSTEAAARIEDNSLDFVYVNARRDYCGVTEDMESFYPKLRPGGIMAGHDYLEAADAQRQSPTQDWSICLDGSMHGGAVKGAVEDFAKKHGHVVSVMYADGSWPSWMIQKPTRLECVSRISPVANFSVDESWLFRASQ